MIPRNEDMTAVDPHALQYTEDDLPSSLSADNDQDTTTVWTEIAKHTTSLALKSIADIILSLEGNDQTPLSQEETDAFMEMVDE